MSLDNFIIIACLVGAVITYGGYRYFSENVYLRFPRTKKEAASGGRSPESGKRKFTQC